jgi:hypothetical protein
VPYAHQRPHSFPRLRPPLLAAATVVVPATKQKRRERRASRPLFSKKNPEQQKKQHLDKMASSRPLFLALLLAVLAVTCLPSLTLAYPAYFVAANSACGAQPTKALGRHRAPLQDPTIVFSVLGPSGKETRLCPGGVYTVSASWPAAGGGRNALLSASSGVFDGSGCRVLTTARVPSVSGTYRVPCGAKNGERISLRVTSATGQSSAFLQGGATLPVVAGCAASVCRGASPAGRSG